jgi:branched-chain amino acid transport system ATP-binding protein
VLTTAGGRRSPGAVLTSAAGETSTAAPADEPEAPDGSGASEFRRHFAQRDAAFDSAPSTLLQCSGIDKEYGGLAVLKAVDLALPRHGIFGLCGPNGAGKTTLLNVVGGSVAPSAGHVSLAGEDITHLLPADRFRRGVSRTFQAVHLIPGRTVIDNVAVACLGSQQSSLVRGILTSRLADARGAAMEALDYLGMRDLAHREVPSLTLETQRMVELARAMASRPRLLLLDEPASGLSEPQRERLKDVLRSIGRFTCVLLVEHDLALVAAVAEKIFVLESGALVFDGTADEFRSSELVSSLLIGV